MLPNNESSFDAGRAEIMMREINLYNESLVRFGSSVQEEFARLADNALKSVIALNSEETNRLVLEIKDIIDQSNVESSKKGLFSALRSGKKRKSDSKEDFAEVMKALNERGRKLDGQRMKARVNLEILEKLHQQNLGYYESLECHILAGKLRLQIARENELKQLQRKAEESQKSEDIAACNYLQDRIDTFEERLCSLETTKTMSSQMEIQIRLMRNSNEQLLQQIEGGSSLISAWKQSAMIDSER